MFVKPRDGYTVRDPDMPHRVLPPEGGNVPDTQYWHQRLLQGDVILADPPGDDAPAVDHPDDEAKE